MHNNREPHFITNVHNFSVLAAYFLHTVLECTLTVSSIALGAVRAHFNTIYPVYETKHTFLWQCNAWVNDSLELHGRYLILYA